MWEKITMTFYKKNSNRQWKDYLKKILLGLRYISVEQNTAQIFFSVNSSSPTFRLSNHGFTIYPISPLPLGQARQAKQPPPVGPTHTHKAERRKDALGSRAKQCCSSSAAECMLLPATRGGRKGESGWTIYVEFNIWTEREKCAVDFLDENEFLWFQFNFCMIDYFGQHSIIALYKVNGFGMAKQSTSRRYSWSVWFFKFNGWI